MKAMARRKPARPWILPLVVILLWLFVGGPLGSFAGKLAEVQENDNAAYLPQSTESTEALNALLEFQAEETFPTTIVFARDGGLTEADLAVIGEYAAELATVENVVEGGVSAPIVSDDGEAAQLVVQAAGTDGEQVTAAVEDMRDVVADPPAGLTALVGGQGGILADFIVAFGAIDGVLLLVALAVVFLILVVVYRSPVLPVVVLLSAVLSLGVASAAIYAAGQGRPADDQRAEPGDPVHPRGGRGHRLLAAHRRPLPGGAAGPGVEVRRHAGGVRRGVRAHPGLGDDRDPWPALPAAVRPLLAAVGSGPVGAIGVAGAMLSSLTLLPAAAGAAAVGGPSGPSCRRSGPSTPTPRGCGASSPG